MSNPIDNFEFILKKQCEKRPFGLYSDNKQQNKHTYKPQDVISSVSLQLKAINQADSLNSVKFIDKNLQKLNKCNFLSVSKLPLYEEVSCCMLNILITVKFHNIDCIQLYINKTASLPIICL